MSRRYRRRYGRRLSTWQKAAVAAVAGVILAGAAHGSAAVTHPRAVTHARTAAPAPDGAAAGEAIAYAKAQLGKRYVWGGTGPDAFDCSGLVMKAYASAGVTIPRTSQAQWAGLRHVSHPRPGDLVFFPGSDGTFAAPGHVALVIGHSRMIQAYAPGVPIEVSPLSGTGAGGIVGYARPSGGR